MDAGTADRHGADATGEAMIRLDSVGKRYRDGTVAVASLSLSVGRGELVALLGPSGCGKSTILRMVNRLVEPTSGRVLVAGRDVTDVHPVRLRRGIGYVIQRVGLLPHLTVAANVATVPELLGWDAGRVRDRVEDVLELVGLDPAQHGRRYPHELSGGQQQRVGVARALAADPPVLLMDEPFGAVDPVVRDHLQGEFRRIQRELGTTVLFVTHDVDEAVRLADRIAVLSEGGHLEQVADPATVLGAPANDVVADFVGSDRGLRRLAVTPVVLDDLAQPVALRLRDTAEAVRHLVAEAPEPFAVVLDDEGRLRGWVSAHALSGTGTVADRVRRFDARAELGDSLRTALAELVQYDVGWLPVVGPDERYLGVLTPEGVYAALRRTAPTPTTSP